MKKAEKKPRSKGRLRRVNFDCDEQTFRRIKMTAVEELDTVKNILLKAFEEYWAKRQKGKAGRRR